MDLWGTNLRIDERKGEINDDLDDLFDIWLLLFGAAKGADDVYGGYSIPCESAERERMKSRQIFPYHPAESL